MIELTEDGAAATGLVFLGIYLMALAALATRLRTLHDSGAWAGPLRPLFGFSPWTNLRALMFVFFPLAVDGSRRLCPPLLLRSANLVRGMGCIVRIRVVDRITARIGIGRCV